MTNKLLFKIESKVIKMYYYSWYGKRKLKEAIPHDFSIISNNCMGGKISQVLGYKYRSPTIGLYIMYPDYTDFLANLDGYLKTPISFKEKSKYESVNYERIKNKYPIGSLTFRKREVEIEFLHYKSIEEARMKWERRCERVDINKLIVLGSEENNCSSSDINSFLSMPFNNNYFFGKTKRKDNENHYYYAMILSSPFFLSLYSQAHFIFKFLCKK